MVQSHIPLREISYSDNASGDVYVQYSLFPQKKAIIFIHGYNSDPIRAWKCFDEYMPTLSGFSGYDIYFYGYDAVKSDVNSSAGLFRDFLDIVYDNSSSYAPAFIDRDRSFIYEELIIVAHSLGAVIARRALVDSVIENKQWTVLIKLLLFAPAHRGAPLIELLKQTLDGYLFIKFMWSIKRFKSPLIEQLHPGSYTLNKLLEDTKRITEVNPQSCLIAKKVVIAELDNVVSNEPFGDDPLPFTIAGKNHKNVCKPNDDYLFPITFLAECL